jgi:diguanylate cyclase (GGDEF)-like protein/PAS domain S-box-containing protein
VPHAKILIVEDDGIISRHIQGILKRNDYQICGAVPSGQDALLAAAEHSPELVLMDIQLEGALDGLETARQIHTNHNIPIIFLTAYADSHTLERAKITDPFGYVLKPFDERTLITNIEMALNKHALELRLRESEEQFRTLVENQGEGLGILDPGGFFIFANPAMETTLGATPGNLVGRVLQDFIAPGFQQREHEEAEKRRQGQKSVYELDIYRLDGKKRTISVTATPWFKNGVFAGTFGLCQDITDRKQMEAAEKDQRALAEALRDTAAVLNSTLSLEEVLNRILNNVGRVVTHDGANIMLFDGTMLKIVRGSGKLGEINLHALGNRIMWENFDFMRPVLEHGTPTCITNFHSPELEELSPAMTWVNSYVAAPIKIKGKVIGILNLGSGTPGFFQSADSERLQAFADQAALAIENARLFEESQKRARYLSLLIQVTQAAINSTDLNVALTDISRVITDLFRSDGAYITLWDDDQKILTPAASFGYSAEVFKSFHFDLTERSLVASVLREGEPTIVANLPAAQWVDPQLSATFPLCSILATPLIAGEQKLGVMMVGYKDAHTFTPEDAAQSQEIATQVALAITKLRLYAEIQRLSITDELTGLYNRRGIFELGRQQVDFARLNKIALAIVWLDIDSFKEINDRYGHHIGDEVISVVAERCRNNIKGRDLAGRYGGEGGDELIILLLDTDLDAAQLVAERVRTVIMASPVSTHDGKIKVTVSLGVTAMREQAEDFQEILARADKAMYEAKKAGRNCVFKLA